MHILLLLIIACLLVYIYFQAQQKDNSQSIRANNSETNAVGKNGVVESAPFKGNLMCLSRGKLFRLTEENQLEQIHSQYIQEQIDRQERSRQLNAWKENTSLGESFTGGTKQSSADQVGLQVISAGAVNDSRICYFLLGENVGGLFDYDFETGEERRLLHQQQLDLQDISYDEESELFYCSAGTPTGIRNLACLDSNGDNLKLLTEGDTIDSSPSPLPGEPHKILHQSAGIGRSEDGYAVATGPSLLQILDTKTQSLTTVLEDARIDYLQPRVHSNGDLYFIRRPYDDAVASGQQTLVDSIMFPFRLLKAVFHYLNFFSLMYSREPLTSASGPKVESDLKHIVLNGKRVDAEKALRKGTLVAGIPSLVPASWQLVCRNKSGQERVVASNVASFDISASGRVVYTNGCGIFEVTESGPSVLGRERVVENLMVN